MHDASSERWDEVDQLLAQVLDQPPDDRVSFLKHACGNDEALLDQLMTLLAQEAAAEAYLAPGVAGFLEEHLTDLVEDVEQTARPLPEAIGPYRILRLLGKGGMGSVYLAERDDETFHKQVAVKVVNRGIDDANLLNRFVYEREILASLDHPHIAQLLDGGTTSDGRPYLVMEYVDGIPITSYCDQHQISTEGRLVLFRTVCRAVHFAHQNLVVHRDLKPTNILVTDQGEGPVSAMVKLLDFGIAKLLDENALRRTAPVTQTGLRLMTPEYASPEQVRGEAITTASDVYQLGVLLYELLTGHRPYRLSKRIRLEIERAILEEAPTRPSTIIGKIEDVDSNEQPSTVSPESVSTARGTSLERLRRSLSGDLDNIVLMALRKEPVRRYASAEQFAEDLKRHSQGLPVHARPNAVSYVLQKFIQRHKWGVGIAAGLVFLLAGFAGMMMWQQAQTVRERDKAQIEAERAEQVTALMVQLFEVNNPDLTQGDTLTAYQVLERGAARITQDLEQQPDLQARMQDALGRVYHSLGAYGQARELFDQALTEDGRSLLSDVEWARIVFHKANLLQDATEYEEAERLFRQALGLRRTALGQVHEEVAESLHGLAWALEIKGDVDGAEQHYREALAMRRSLLGVQHLNTAETLARLGIIYRYRDQYDEAERHIREALEIRRALLGEIHTHIAESLTHLSIVKLFQLKVEEAVVLQREAVQMYRQLLGEDHPMVIKQLIQLASGVGSLPDLDQSEELYRQALDLSIRQFGEASEWVGVCKEQLGLLLMRRGDAAGAERLLREVKALYMTIFEEHHPRISEVTYRLGRTLHQQEQYKEAEGLYREALAIHRFRKNALRNQTARMTRHLGQVLMAQGALGEAERLLREALGIYRSILEPVNKYTHGVLIDLGKCLTQLRQYTDAESVLFEAQAQLNERKKTDSTLDPAPTQTALAELYTAWGQPDKAKAYR